MDPTATQMTTFTSELKAAIRRADARTKKGRAVTDVALVLLESPAAAEEIWRCISVSWRTDPQLRRVRQDGYDEGYDEGYNRGLGDNTMPEEGDSK